MAQFSAYQRFAGATAEGRSTKLLRRILIPLLCVHAVLALISGYRAIVQIFRLDLRVSASRVQVGSRLGFYVVASGRARATARIELVQGSRAETLAVAHVKANWDPAYDPRPARDSAFIVVSPELLARFAPGRAILRGTAIGSPQWMRTPPPTVREQVVELAR